MYSAFGVSNHWTALDGCSLLLGELCRFTLVTNELSLLFMELIICPRLSYSEVYPQRTIEGSLQQPAEFSSYHPHPASLKVSFNTVFLSVPGSS